jgi:hypothetical protein
VTKEEMRFRAALEILVHNISPAMRDEAKVEEAVKLADKLVAELEKNERSKTQS